MANRRPPRPEERGHGPSRRPNAGRPPRPGQTPPPRTERPRPRQAQEQEATGGEERLQKILAHAGIGSRRACEDVIRQGRVTINGQVVRELGTKVDPQQAKIAVDGQVIHLERMVYYAVSKPKGYVSTNNDPAGRPRVVDILPEIPQRVYTVGRLDEMSTGLILLTNDGELANKLAHPKFGVEKLYRVVVAGTPDREVLDKLVEGVWLAEGKVRARRVRVVGKKGQATVLEMVLAEGKNREVRRMLAKLGHKVMSLTRIAVGPIGLKGLAFGEYRPLSQNEVDLLRRVAAGETVAPARPPSRRPQGAPGRGRPSGSAEPRRDSADSHSNAGGPPPRPPRRSSGGSTSEGPRRPYGAGASQGPRGNAGGARRPSTGRPEYGASDSRPPRPEGLPPSQRRPASGRPVAGPSGYRPPGPQGPPPSQRRSGSDSGRPAYGASSSGSRPPRPEGVPPSQRRPGTGRPTTGGSSSGPRPPRPGGPPSSQRRPATEGGPRRPVRTRSPSDEPPQRRIIGLDSSGPPREGPPQGRPKPHIIKRRPPRSALGPRKPRPKRAGEE
jgi:23S rRNA pseudouridine2605 synthase